MSVSRVLIRSAVACFLASLTSLAHSAEWSVPAAGNAFRSAPAPGGNDIQREGFVALTDPQDVFSIYFHIDRPAKLDLSLNARVPDGHSSVTARVGESELVASLQDADFARHKLGHVEIPQAGFFKETGKAGDVFIRQSSKDRQPNIDAIEKG
jgi:hypothetical protein